MGRSFDAELTVAQAAFERGYLTVRELRLALILHEELERVGTPRPLLALLPALRGDQESDLQAVYQSAQDSALEQTRGLPSPLRDDDVPDAIRVRALERAQGPVTQDSERVRRALATMGIGDFPDDAEDEARAPAEAAADAPLPEVVAGMPVLGVVQRGPRRLRLRVEDAEGETRWLDALLDGWSAEERARVTRDAAAATRLRHRNLLSVLRSGEEGGRPWWTVEPSRGTALAGELASGPLEPGQAAWIVERLARGLAAAHGQGLGRGGRLTAEEVWLSPEGEPQVVGFDPGPALDAAGRPDPGEDVRALGRLLHEALTGARPDPADREPPSAARPELPGDLDAICLRARAPAREDRYPSALHLAEDLDLFLSGAGVSLDAALPLGARVQRLALQRPGAVLGVLAGVGVALLVVTGLSWRAAGEASRRRAAAEAELSQAQTRAAEATERAARLALALESRPARPAPQADAPERAQRAVWDLVAAIRAERDLPGATRTRLLARAYAGLVGLRKEAGLEDRDWDRVGRLALEAGRAEQALAAFDRAASQVERGPEYLAAVDEGRARALLALGQLTKAEDALGKVLPHRRARGDREPVALLATLELQARIARRRNRDDAVGKLHEEILRLARALPGRGFDAATEARVVALIDRMATAERERGDLAFARDAWGWVYARLAAQRPVGAPAGVAQLQRAARLRLRLVGLDVSLGRTPDRSGLGELASALEARSPDDPVAAALRATSLRLRSAEHQEKGELAKARQAAVEAVAQAQRARAADLPGSRLLLAAARLQVGRTAAPEQALPELEGTVLLLRALAAGRAADPGPKRVLAEALEVLGRLRLGRGEVEPAVRLANEAVALRRKVGPLDGLGEALLLQGEVQRKAGEREAAARTFAAALELWERLHAAPSARTTRGLRRALTAVAEEKLEGAPREALALAERALELQTGVEPIPELERLHSVARLLSQDRQPESPQDYLELAYAFQATKQYSEALSHFTQALADPKLRADLQRSNLYNGACAACLAATVDPAEAEPRRKQALAWLAEDLGRRHRFVARLAKEARRRDDPRLKARLAGLKERWREHLRWVGQGDPDLASLRDWPEFKRLLARYASEALPPRKP